jgi:molecular chaperone GrpE
MAENDPMTNENVNTESDVPAGAGPEGVGPEETGAQGVADEQMAASPDPETSADIPEGGINIEISDDDDDEPAGEEVGPEGRVEILQAQVSDLNDKLLRALAETENVRRRAQRDKEDASKYAIKSFAEQMITVSDNLGRALQSVDADARADNSALDNIVVGIEMVCRELNSGFERSGIMAIEALGQKFDPMMHEAMYEIEDKTTVAGTVAHVLEVGYVLNGRTLRAAKVGITKGGPKIAPVAETAEEGGDADASKDNQTAYESKGAEPGSQLDQEL